VKGRFGFDYERDGGTLRIQQEGRSAIVLNFEEVFDLWALLDSHKSHIQRLQQNKLIQDFADLEKRLGVEQDEQTSGRTDRAGDDDELGEMDKPLL
jgi:hypothetical protein